MMIKIGEKVKNFKIKDQNDVVFDSSQRAQEQLLLSFHPLAWTSVCTRQMQSLEKNFIKFQELKIQAVGVSVDHVPCKAAWAKRFKINQTRLLCDFWPHGDFAKSLDIFREKNGFSERANIILDASGKVIFAKVYPISELPDIKEILTFLKALKKK